MQQSFVREPREIHLELQKASRPKTTTLIKTGQRVGEGVDRLETTPTTETESSSAAAAAAAASVTNPDNKLQPTGTTNDAVNKNISLDVCQAGGPQRGGCLAIHLTPTAASLPNLPMLNHCVL